VRESIAGKGLRIVDGNWSKEDKKARKKIAHQNDYVGGRYQGKRRGGTSIRGGLPGG